MKYTKNIQTSAMEFGNPYSGIIKNSCKMKQLEQISGLLVSHIQTTTKIRVLYKIKIKKCLWIRFYISFVLPKLLFFLASSITTSLATHVQPTGSLLHAAYKVCDMHEYQLLAELVRVSVQLFAIDVGRGKSFQCVQVWFQYLGLLSRSARLFLGFVAVRDICCSVNVKSFKT